MSDFCFTFLIVVLFVVCPSDFVEGSLQGGIVPASKRYDQQRYDHFAGYLNSTIFDQIVGEIPSEQCRRQVIRHQEHANNFSLWAIQMIDATSKPSGILGGAIYHLGNYDECMAVDNGEAGALRITGKYCIAAVELSPKVTSKDSKCSADHPNSCSAWDKLRAPSNRMKLQRNRLHVAVCVPSACTAHDLQMGLKLLETELQTISIRTEIDESMCQTENPKSEKWLTLFWCAVIVYASFLLAYDRLLVKNKNVDAYPTVIHRAFSVRYHWEQLSSMEPREGTEGISCIHGMRVFSMIVIVMGHRGEALTAGPLVNGDSIEQMYEDFLSILAMNGHLIVDVFFTISGFLVCWNLLRGLETGKKINVLSLYINRYLRLTPALMLVVAFEALVLFDLSTGPLWKHKVGAERDNCRNYWWTNLLYVNNYVHPEHPCVDPSWYLACDMQMFLVAPFVVLGLHRWKKHGSMVLKSAISISILVPFLITYIGDLDPTIIPDPSTLGHSVENYTYVSVYVTAYCRAGPYFVGMAFAHWLHSNKSRNAKIPKGVLWSGWVLGPLAQFAMLAAAVVFYQPDHQLSKFTIALYAALHRTVFSVGVAFSIAACASGQGGLVNRLLSWSRLRPFSRLTYSVFLCHTVVQMYHFASVRTPMFMSYTDIVWLSISDLVISVMFATILYLTVERPVMVLSTALLEMGSSTRIQENPKRESIRATERRKSKNSNGSNDSLDIVGLALAQLIEPERGSKKRG